VGLQAGACASNTTFLVNRCTENSHDSPLSLAAAGGNAEMVRFLISEGANIYHRDKKGKQLLSHFLDFLYLPGPQTRIIFGVTKCILQKRPTQLLDLFFSLEMCVLPKKGLHHFWTCF